MWADTYVDLFKVGIDASTQPTAESQINQTQVEPAPTNSRCGPEPAAEGAKVSSHTKTMSECDRCVNIGK